MSNSKRILVVDDSRTVRHIIGTELEAEGYQVFEAADGLQALEFISNKFIPDLVTLDLDMPNLDGLSTYKRLLGNEFMGDLERSKLEEMPVIFISGTDTIAIRQEGFALGATDFLTKPFNGDIIRSVVDKALNSDIHLRGLTALVVDDSRTNRLIVKRILSQEGISVLEAEDGVTGYEMVCNRMSEIDLVVTDLFMPEMNGDEFCQKIRRELELQSLPVIFLTGMSEQSELLKLFKAGATDYIVKPFAKEELLARLSIHLERGMLAARLKRSVSEQRVLIAMRDKLLSLRPDDLHGPLAELQGEIRDVGRLHYADLSLEMEELSTGELVRKGCSVMGLLAEKKGQRIELDCTTDQDLIRGDGGEMLKVIHNLLSNAIKFSAADSTIRIVISSPDSNQLQIAIEDSGVGIPPEDIPGLFDNYTPDGEQERWHGLSTVREIVNRHGGRIEADSVLDGGTTFTVYLPRESQSPESEEVSGEGRSIPLLARGDDGPTLNILLAEDERICIRVASELLQRSGHRVTVAHDGLEAVSLTQIDEYDLILMDLIMPRLDGIEATRRIRMKGDLRTPIIALTANSERKMIDRCEAVGMNGFLAKPLCVRELQALLAKWFVPVAD